MTEEGLQQGIRQLYRIQCSRKSVYRNQLEWYLEEYRLFENTGFYSIYFLSRYLKKMS